MKHRSVLSVVGAVLWAQMAFAESTVWNFFEKKNGKTTEACGIQLTLRTTSDSVTVYRKFGEGLRDNLIQEFQNLNQGKVCQRSPNGSVFGNLRCHQHTFQRSGNVLTFVEHSCSTELPLLSSCFLAGGPTAALQIDLESDQVVFASVDSSKDAKNNLLECVYKAR